MKKLTGKKIFYSFAAIVFILYLIFAKVLFLDIFPGAGVNPVKKIDLAIIKDSADSPEISLDAEGLNQDVQSMRQWCTYSNTVVLNKEMALKPNLDFKFILLGEKNVYSVDLKGEKASENGLSYMVSAKFSTHRIEPGEYRTGILVLDRTGKNYIRWEGYTLKNPNEVVLQKYLGKWVDSIPNPERIESLNYYMDGAKNLIIADRKYLCIFGWTFINDMNSSDQKVFIEVEDQSQKKLFRQAIAIFRPGFTELFKSPRYAMAGFEAYIPAEELQSGEYRVRIIVENGDKLVTHAGYYNLQYNNLETDPLPITKVEG